MQIISLNALKLSAASCGESSILKEQYRSSFARLSRGQRREMRSLLNSYQHFRENQFIIADSVKILDSRRQLVTVLFIKPYGFAVRFLR